jgi:glycosyltransferase involved in cell wall biosynthesis
MALPPNPAPSRRSAADSSSLRVALDARYLVGPRGGIAYTIENLLLQYKDLEPGLDLLLVVRPGRDLPDLSPLRVREAVFGPDPHGLRNVYGFQHQVNVDDYPVYHAPHNILPRGVRTRTLLTLHDVMWLQSSKNISLHPLRRLFAGWFFKTYILDSARRADHIIAVSKATRDALCDFLPEAKAKISVVPNGRDPYFEPIPEREALDLTRDIVPEGKRIVLVIGNGSPHKNHARAVKSYMRAFGDRDDMRMVLVRRFVRSDREMAALLRRSDVSSRVILLPYVTREVIRALYCRARIFFFPSWVEGFGLPILEAMACETPVLTASVSAPAEVAGDAALLADPFDVDDLSRALARLDSDEGLRRDLVARGLSRTLDFSWTESAQRTLEIYRDLADGRRP